MKNLNDLISQITDERILKILREAQKDGVYCEGYTSVFDISQADKIISNWKVEVMLLNDDYEETGQDSYRHRAEIMQDDITHLEKLKETAYLFVLLHGQPIRSISSVEECEWFFNGRN